MLQERFQYIFGLTRGKVQVNGAIVDDVNNTFSFALDEAVARINQSDSGLFLDEMDEFNLNKVPVELNPDTGLPIVNTLWDKAARARHNAIGELETALFAGLATMNKLKSEPFLGVLGSATTRGYLSLNEGQSVTTVIQTSQKPGHVVRIKSIGLHTSLDATVPVTINGTEYEVRTRAGRLYANIQERPIVVPLNGEDIVISYPVGEFLVGNNKMCYTCSGQARKITPYFPNIETQEGNGLVLDIQVGCQPDNMIYENYYNQIHATDQVLAYAARFKTAELLIESIMNSTEINRYTTMDNQFLWGKRNHFRKEFQDRVNWLVSPDGFDLSTDNCYQCKPQVGFRKRGILS